MSNSTSPSASPPSRNILETVHEFPNLVRRDTGRRCILLFVAVILGSILVTAGIWAAHDTLFAASGGELVDGRAIPNADSGRLAFWTYKLLYEGFLTYSIIAAFIAVIGYGCGVVLFGLSPMFFSFQRELGRFRKVVENPEGTEYRRLAQIAAAAELAPNGLLMTRIRILERSAGTGTVNRESLHSTNDRYTAAEEGMIHHVLMPLTYLEWLLPILGFLGTVWGVTEAVDGLRNGIQNLFRAQELTEVVLANFMTGFQGLVLAFDTTLFGLIGLGLAGSISFGLRKSALYILMSADKWCGVAIDGLKAADDPLIEIEKLLRKGFFVTDEEGDLELADDGTPKPRMLELIRDLEHNLRRGLFETTADGKIEPDESGRPTPRLQQPLEMLLRGLFVTGPDGKVLVSGGAPAERSAAARNRIHHLLVNHVFEIAPGMEVSPEGHSGVTTDGREVPLRNRTDRQHRETLAYLHLLATILMRGGPGGDEPETSIRVLDATGHPVGALAVTRGRFAVSRAKLSANGYEEFVLATGEFSSLGNVSRPVANPNEFPLSDRASALCGFNDLLAILLPDSSTMFLGDWCETMPDPVVLDTARVVPIGIGLLPVHRIPHAIAIIQGQDRSALRVVAWDRSEADSAPKQLAEFTGDVVAFASRPGDEAALVVQRGGNLHVLILRGDAVIGPIPLERPVSALAYAKDGTLWWVDSDNSAGIWRASDQMLERRRPFPAVRHLTVTAHGQLVGGNNDRILFVAGIDDAHEPSRIETEADISCIAVSAGGEHLLTGHADGSVFYRDGRRPLR
jgi:biopolymer transport protein ExbB/TolQ